jgi:rubrerythrin
MDKIKKMKCHLKDEAHGAQKYAEKYIFYANDRPEWAETYARMAKQEAEHARYLHKMYQESVKEMRWVPETSLQEWEQCVAEMNETLALVEVMLSK